MNFNTKKINLHFTWIVKNKIASSTDSWITMCENIIQR